MGKREQLWHCALAGGGSGNLDLQMRTETEQGLDTLLQGVGSSCDACCAPFSSLAGLGAGAGAQEGGGSRLAVQGQRLPADHQTIGEEVDSTAADPSRNPRLLMRASFSPMEQKQGSAE